MFIEYTPEGQPTQHFEFDPGRVRLGESAGIETLYSRLMGDGRTIQQWLNDVRLGGAVARRILLHRLLRKEHPTIRFEDVDPYEDEIKVVFSKQEYEELRANVERSGSMTESEKEKALADIEREIAGAREGSRPGKAAGTSTTQSDPSATSGESTS